jgi:uncharacterized protein (DUF1015 family)
MAEIHPFRALHYDVRKVADLGKVVTQPYDKISPEMQERYYALSPYNLVRIIRAREEPPNSGHDDVYTRAARDFKAWVQNRVLAPEAEPALYPYFQRYEVPGQPGIRKERRGFIGLCRLEDYSAGIVHRHEETLSAPKAGRIELLRKTHAHFGQIFFLYNDPDGSVEQLFEKSTAQTPWEQVLDEYQTEHSVWRVSDASTIQRVSDTMKGKKLLIADGHHRYETALACRDLSGEAQGGDTPSHFVMATFIRMEGEGLTILPTHRVVHGLAQFDWDEFEKAAKEYFETQEMEPRMAREAGGSGLLTLLAESGHTRPTIATCAAGRLAFLQLRHDFNLARALPDLSEAQRPLDVILLHRLLLDRVLAIGADAVREEKNLRYVRDLSEAVAAVDSGKAQVAFLLNPTPVEAVRDVAFAGDVMPQKSTDFYPKLLSGLTIYWLDNPTGI